MADLTLANNELDLAREVEARAARPLLKAYNCAAHLLCSLPAPPLAYEPLQPGAHLRASVTWTLDLRAASSSVPEGQPQWRYTRR